MANITSIYLGKVVKIEDPETWTIRVNILGQPEFDSEKEPLALPWGSVTTRIEAEDNVILFQVSDRLLSLFYLPIKTNGGRIGIYNKDTFIDITDPDQVVIKTQKDSYAVVGGELYVKVDGKVQIDYNGEVSLNVKNKLKLNGPGQLELKGVVTPDTSSFSFNVIPACPMTGAPHGGCTMLLVNPSDPPKEVPETEPQGDE